MRPSLLFVMLISCFVASPALAVVLNITTSPSEICKTSLSALGFDGAFAQAFHDLANLLAQMREVPTESASFVMMEEQYRRKIQEFERLLISRAHTTGIKERFAEILEQEVALLTGEIRKDQTSPDFDKEQRLTEKLHIAEQIEALLEEELTTLRQELDEVNLALEKIDAEVKKGNGSLLSLMKFQPMLGDLNKERVRLEDEIKKKEADLIKVKREAGTTAFQIIVNKIQKLSPTEEEKKNLITIYRNIVGDDPANIGDVVGQLSRYYEELLARRGMKE